MMQSFRHRVRALRARLSSVRSRNRGLQEIFEGIYSKGSWGGQEMPGPSTPAPAAIRPVEALRRHHQEIHP